MPREYTPKVVTAHDLRDGHVVYQTVDDRWSEQLTEAEVLTDEAHAQLRLLEAERQTTLVTGAYLAEMRQTDNGPVPAHFREAFRATGPSNYRHGKQEAR
jgi:hypothetical protein